MNASVYIGCIRLILFYLLLPSADCTNSSVIQYAESQSNSNDSFITLHLGNQPHILALMYSDSEISVNYSIICPDEETTYRLRMVTDDKSVAFIRNADIVTIPCAANKSGDTEGIQESRLQQESDNYEIYGSFNLTLGTDLLGRTWLDFILLDNVSGVVVANKMYNQSIDEDGLMNNRILRILVVVIRPLRNLDTVFQVIVYIVVISSTIGMGCKTELEVVRDVLKKPIAPAIGFFCQYICMPLIAFGIAKAIKFDNPAVGLGIFACGICPGGGISNLYCYVLNGDVSLSVTMTTLSTVAALGLIPFWMFTLGSLFQDDKTKINIPYINIMSTLALVIIPLFFGMLLKYKCLKVSKVILKIVKPLTFVAIIILLSFGIYVNLFIFRLFSPIHILAGCLLPYFGYIIGGLVALIFRQPWYRVKTIAIETGIQNVGVAFLMLMTSLPPPDGDLAAVGPAASGIMTPLPLFVITIIYVIYNKCQDKKYQGVPAEDKNKLKTEIEVNGNNVKTFKEVIIKESVSTV